MTPKENPPAKIGQSDLSCLNATPAGLWARVAVSWIKKIVIRSTQVATTTALVAVGIRLSTSMKARYG